MLEVTEAPETDDEEVSLGSLTPVDIRDAVVWVSGFIKAFTMWTTYHSFPLNCLTHTHSPGFLSGWVHAEKLNALRVPVQTHSGVKDQGPDVRDEEILRLVFLDVFEF